MAKRNIAHLKSLFKDLASEFSKFQKLYDKSLYHTYELSLLMDESDESMIEINEIIKDLRFSIGDHSYDRKVSYNNYKKRG